MKWQPTPVFLPGESQGQESLVGCRLWGRTESDMTEVTWQQQQSKLSYKTTYSKTKQNKKNPCLLHWQADSLLLSHQGSPSIVIFVL